MKIHQEGVCPICDDDCLNYGDFIFSGNKAYYTWECEQCGSSGEEWYELNFINHQIKGKDY